MNDDSSRQLTAGAKVQFTKRTTVYNEDDNTSFYVKTGTIGEVLQDNDAGDIGSCRLKLAIKDSNEITVETNDANLKAI